MNEQTKKIVAAIVLTAIITWAIKPTVVAPQPRRPILAWIANTARAVGMAFLFTRVLDDEPELSQAPEGHHLAMVDHAPEVPLVRAMGVDGVPLIDNGEGW